MNAGSSGFGMPPYPGTPPPTPPWGLPQAQPAKFDFATNPMIAHLASSLLANRGHFGGAMSTFGQGMPQAMALQQQTQAKARQREAMNAALRAISARQPVPPEVLAELPEEWAMKLGMPPEAKAPISVGRDSRLYDLNTKTFIDQPGGTAANPPYEGTSMDAQNWNIVLRGASETPEYAAAYNQLFLTPKMVSGQDADGRMIVTPLMPTVPPGVKPPSGGSVPTTAVAPAGAAPLASPGSASAPGQPIVVGQKRPTEAEIKGNTLLANSRADYDRATTLFTALESTGEQALGLAGITGRVLQSADYQTASDAVQNIIQSYIYAVSGQQAPEQEVARNMRLVLPALGDKAQTVAAKKSRLESMMRAIEERAGEPGAVTGTPASAAAPSAAPVEDPLGIR
jgi:hypothetical protein